MVVNNVRINIGDPNDKEFMESATMHEMAMKQDEMAGEESIPGIAEEATPAGLMTRPTAGV